MNVRVRERGMFRKRQVECCRCGIPVCVLSCGHAIGLLVVFLTFHSVRQEAFGSFPKNRFEAFPRGRRYFKRRADQRLEKKKQISSEKLFFLLRKNFDAHELFIMLNVKDM